MILFTLALVVTLQQPSDSVIRALLLPRVAALPEGTGIAVGLLDATGRRRIIAVGVDSAAVFEIGSITKVFTTSLLQNMVDRGEVRLGDAVAQLLPRSATVRFPIYAESDSTFFLKVVDAQITFSGEVLTLHQNGRDISGRRIREN